MPPVVNVGAVLIEEGSLSTQLLGLENEPYLENWRLVKVLDGFALDRKIHAAGWNFFFMAGGIETMFLGAIEATKLQNALKRLLGKVREHDLNSLEVTGIVAKRFLGVPYAIVTAHSRHIQQTCCLDSAKARRTRHRDTEWARG